MIEEKLTDKQVKLVNTIQELIDCDKKQNEFGGIIIVNRHFLKEVLILINRLKEENKELNEEIDTFNHLFNQWVRNWNKLLKENKELEAENERLKKELEEGYTAKEVDEIANSKVRITRKKTAEKCREFVKNWIGNDIEECLAFLFDFEDFITKEFGVEIK